MNAEGVMPADSTIVAIEIGDFGTPSWQLEDDATLTLH
jgi:hypothetical protein